MTTSCPVPATPPARPMEPLLAQAKEAVQDYAEAEAKEKAQEAIEKKLKEKLGDEDIDKIKSLFKK